MQALNQPTATYRLQFNSGFTFKDAQDLVPYLHRLGISHVYASPIFKARKGSTHGYDVVDPTRLNPELGPTSDFLGLVGALKAHAMGLIIDIVPNHMAASLENAWWRDVLESGPTSEYASFFDIGWREPGTTAASQLVLPVLGRPYEDVLAAGEVRLGLDSDGFHIHLYGQTLPVEAKAIGAILGQCLSGLSAGLNHDEKASLRRLVTRTRRLSPWQTTSLRGSSGRRRAASRIKEEISRLAGSALSVESALEATAQLFNSDSEGLTAGGLLDRLLAQQPYRLTYWRDGSRMLNYRRFFDINDLAGIRVEDPAVFEATHSLIFELADQGHISGVRIDHVDGLKDPAAYLRRLRRRLGPDCYISVEKILAHDEPLPEPWPVQGTTGYEFVNRLNGLFVDPDGLEEFAKHFREAVGSNQSFADVAYEKKRLAALQLFPGELNRLARALHRLAAEAGSTACPAIEQFERALLEVTACLTVYRTYITGDQRGQEDLRRLETALDEAVRRNGDIEPAAIDFLRRVLAPGGLEVRVDAQGAVSDFISQWQQFTGPLAAKGVEDTALYTHVPLVSVNEVGGDPDHGSTPVNTFHGFCQERQDRWPMSMNATSTHDTKRSEDVRARLNALSEAPALWLRHFQHWTSANQQAKSEVRGRLVPAPFEEWLLYQTLLGAWPLDEGDLPEFKNRTKDYLVKAARESKTHTSWLEPDVEHENALRAFVDSILSETGNNRFLPDFLDLQGRVADWGLLNSLSQLVVKLTAPGVPDIYQGTETWDFSLVDPDNRRPVDFDTSSRFLNGLELSSTSRGNYLRGLVDSWRDGQIKLLITRQALEFRRKHPALFRHGSYATIQTDGAKAENVCGFVRQHGHDWSITVVPRLVTKFGPAGTPPTGEGTWGKTQLRLPTGAPAEWSDVFSGGKFRQTGPVQGLPVAEVFQHLPVAVLHGQS